MLSRGRHTTNRTRFSTGRSLFALHYIIIILLLSFVLLDPRRRDRHDLRATCNGSRCNAEYCICMYDRQVDEPEKLSLSGGGTIAAVNDRYYTFMSVLWTLKLNWIKSNEKFETKTNIELKSVVGKSSGWKSNTCRMLHN